MYDIIVLEKLRFRPSTRKREAGFFKNLHSGERLWKDAFSVTVFTEFIRVDGRTNRKKKYPLIQTNRDKCGQGLGGAALALVVQKVDNAIHRINKKIPRMSSASLKQSHGTTEHIS